jgi:4-amino-4-deoxy-L-arabinose transferase-like glycosyltransferase
MQLLPSNQLPNAKADWRTEVTDRSGSEQNRIGGDGRPTLGVSARPLLVLAGALLIGCLNYIQAIDDRAPKKDGFHYYCIAANIHEFGVYSGDCEGDVTSGADLEPTMRREPGLPALLSLTFAAAGGYQDMRACATLSSELCSALRTRQRIILLLPFLGLILLTYFAGKDITENDLLAAAAALCAAFGAGLIANSMAFLTEPLAAFLLLLVSWMLYRIVAKPRRIVLAAICGGVLGLLALTKAAYFYFIPVLALAALIATAVPSQRRAGLSGLVAVMIAAMISGAWVYRNHEVFGQYAISGRAEKVMGIRAVLTTMTWSQYWTSYLASTPVIGGRLIRIFGIDPSGAAFFEKEPNPEVFLEHTDDRQRQAIRIIVEHWPMQIALIPLTIYRSAFLPVGMSSHQRYGASTGMRLLRMASLAIATIIALGMLPVLLFNFFSALAKPDLARLAFLMLSIYTVGFHAVATHYSPRFNLPLFGVLAIELCIVVWWVSHAAFSRKRWVHLTCFPRP